MAFNSIVKPRANKGAGEDNEFIWICQGKVVSIYHWTHVEVQLPRMQEGQTDRGLKSTYFL